MVQGSPPSYSGQNPDGEHVIQTGLSSSEASGILHLTGSKSCVSDGKRERKDFVRGPTCFVWDFLFLTEEKARRG